MPLVHLHRHSEYSLLDGTGTATQYAERAVELGQEALALTDHGTLAGLLHHVVACEQAGIKPIAGMEAYFRDNRLLHKPENEKRFHLVLLARNHTGWHNLIRMASEAYRTGYYYKPCVDWDLLSRFREGLIVTTACMSSPLGRAVETGSDTDARGFIARLQGIFGSSLAVEIMPNQVPFQQSLNKELVGIANEMSVPLIATADVHYPYKEWSDTQDILVMASTKQTMASRKAKMEAGEDVYSMGDPTLYLMDEADLLQTFKNNHPDLPESVVRTAIANTAEVARVVKPYNIDKSPKLPKVKTEISTEVTVRAWCEEGLKRIGKSHDSTYRDRMDYELGVLGRVGVYDYFYIIGDMVRWALARGIRRGPGRGSAAGCLVSYLIGITGLDPIAHGLLFERFINPDRKGMPDIDIDFPTDRRTEVYEYLLKKWGASKVVSVSAFQKFGPKSALNDISRVYDVPFAEARAVTTPLDDDGGNLAELRKTSPELDRFATKWPDVWKHATRLEGQVKTLSKHPAGVILTDKDATEYLPLLRSGDDGDMRTAWSEASDFRIISDYGFLKIDVLSTNALAVQQKAIDYLRADGIEVNLDTLGPESDPANFDPEVIQAFCDRQTLGVFQFSTPTMIGLTKEVQPENFDHLSDINALVRPGPRDSGIQKSYILRKRGQETITYWHDSLRGFLGDTLGLMIYQEQVMRVAEHLAGFTPGQADEIRKVTSKYAQDKKAGAKVMATYEKAFVDGALKSGLSKAEAKTVWAAVAKFSTYSFNKSHSASYSLQAYQDMWLKVNYPAYFYAAMATFREKQVPAIVREARMRDIKVSPPDINLSDEGFTVLDKDTILFGISAIKGVGPTGVRVIKEMRPFASYEDFKDRVPLRSVNTKTREALVASGAFDSFGLRDDWDTAAKVSAEKDTIDFALSGTSDLSRYKKVLSTRIDSREVYEDKPDGAVVYVGGEVSRVREQNDRRGNLMAFVDLDYGLDSWKVVCFSNKWDTYSSLFVVGKVVLVQGTKDADFGSIKLDHAVDLEAMIPKWKELGYV